MTVVGSSNNIKRGKKTVSTIIHTGREGLAGGTAPHSTRAA